MSAWVKQIASQVKKHGAAKASWYCFWNEPDGTRRKKSCGVGGKGKRKAEQKAERIKAELLTGTYDAQKTVEWSQFRKEYEERVLIDHKPGGRQAVGYSLSHLERVLKLANKKLSAITASAIDRYKSERRKERGAKRGSTVSAATVNKDLRHIKAALRKAHEWGYIEKVPPIRLVKESKKLPRYITSEDFAKLYEACESATRPTENFTPAEWWRGLLVFAQMTGWRIGEILALEWDDVDLEAGTAITRAADNKGGRDEAVGLHAVVVEHLRPLRGFSAYVFPWEKNRRRLYGEFDIIQDAAGINLPCIIDRPHECTTACHRYGFHDERRAFASLNAPNMTREALQALMRHKSSQTTERYINFANQLQPAVANLVAPDVLRKDIG